MTNPFLVYTDRELRALPKQWLFAEPWEKADYLLDGLKFMVRGLYFWTRRLYEAIQKCFGRTREEGTDCSAPLTYANWYWFTSSASASCFFPLISQARMCKGLPRKKATHTNHLQCGQQEIPAAGAFNLASMALCFVAGLLLFVHPLAQDTKSCSISAMSIALRRSWTA